MRYVLVWIFCVRSLLSFAQVFPSKNYPQGYFRDPLNIPMSLAANFGELRPGHYHMGLDIRTQKKENLPVFAAADGYIAKVKIEPAGFGQAIYINHPNGYTTLYAHLNHFIPALADWIEQRQYRTESWKVFITVPPGLFPVKKGDLIAYSGNTGGSQGPHLHFEIRRTPDDINLNPLLFGLPVPDNVPPVIQRLAIYDRGLSLYEQTPKIFSVRMAGAGSSAMAGPGPASAPPSGHALYSIGPDPVITGASRISFAISAFDTQSGSANPNGIYQAVLFDNDQAVVGFQMDNIGYDDTHTINAHIDYKTRETGGPFLQHLSRLPGYTSPSIYRSAGSGVQLPPGPLGPPRPEGSSRPEGSPQDHPADGVIDLGDGQPHVIRIEVGDAYGNTSELRYRVQYRPTPGIATADSQATDRAADRAADRPSDKKFYPGMLDGYETVDCAFYIAEKSLYDSVHIHYSVVGYPGSGISLPGAVSAVHSIGAVYIPLQDPLLVRIRAGQELTPAEKEKIVMVRTYGNTKEAQRPEWQGGWASARFHEFGNFQLVADEEAPVILPVGFTDGAMLDRASRIAFMVRDNLGAIRNFRAELDGKWLCFANDKGLAFVYKFDRHCPAGKHILRVSVEDEAGNRAVKEYKFTR
ncbi:MAG TPA: M23 family metallopeptidase [Puia sp.]|nr:M23 family metallopeptidase [Puia sp.]